MALAASQAKRIGLDPSRIQTVGLVALLAGIAGARFTYVLSNWDWYHSHPLEIIRLDHGGLIFYGGFAAALLACLFTIARAGLPVWRTVDLLVPPVVLAHALGRVGCFLNGCCYGRPTSVPWAVVFPLEGIPRHPTQLYESGLLLILFLLLSRIGNRPATKPGTVILTYGLLYGIWRFFVEFFRGDNPVIAGGLTIFQWMSLPLVVGCGVGLVRLSLRTPKG